MHLPTSPDETGPVLTPEGFQELLKKARLVRGSLGVETEEWGPLIFMIEGKDDLVEVEEDDGAKDETERFVVHLPPNSKYRVHLVSQQAERPAMLMGHEGNVEKFWTVGYSPVQDPTQNIPLDNLPFVRSTRIPESTKGRASGTFVVPNAQESLLLLAAIQGKGTRPGAPAGVQEHARSAVSGLTGLDHLLLKKPAPSKQTPPKVQPVNALGAISLTIRDPDLKKKIL